jgi:hypothetical protein
MYCTNVVIGQRPKLEEKSPQKPLAIFLGDWTASQEFSQKHNIYLAFPQCFSQMLLFFFFHSYFSDIGGFGSLIGQPTCMGKSLSYQEAPNQWDKKLSDLIRLNNHWLFVKIQKETKSGIRKKKEGIALMIYDKGMVQSSDL